MKKLFISQPMRGKSDEEILAERQKAIEAAEKMIGEPVEVIDSFFEKAPVNAKKEKELSDRESAVARKELMAEAKNTLAEKKLPAGLAEVLNYTNAESCNKSIDAVEKAFQAAVEAAVQERLKGGEPPKTPPNTGDDMAKQVEALMMGRI